MNRLLLLLMSLMIFSSVRAQKSVTITPGQARKGDHLTVTITGTNTNFQSGTNMVQFFKQGTYTTMIQGTPTAVINSGAMVASLFVKASATTGAYTYAVYSWGEGIIYGNANFTVLADSAQPALTSISPSVGGLNQNLTVTITGSRTSFTKGSPTVFFTKGTSTLATWVTGAQAINDSLIQATVTISPDAERGLYDLNVAIMGAEFLTLPEAFEVAWPIGLNQAEKNTGITIYPNPAKDMIYLNDPASATELIEVRNMLGQHLLSIPVPEPQTRIEVRLDALPPGDQVILLRVKTSNGEFWFKALKQQ